MEYISVSYTHLDVYKRQVLNWLINLITASQLINFVVLCIIYLFFRRTYSIQQDSLPKLPFRSWGQPYTAIIGLVSCLAMIMIQGYTVFFPKLWNSQDFLFSYLMVFIDIGIYVGYKFIWKRGKDKVKDPYKIDFSKELIEIENHEIQYSFEKFQYYSKA